MNYFTCYLSCFVIALTLARWKTKLGDKTKLTIWNATGIISRKTKTYES